MMRKAEAEKWIGSEVSHNNYILAWGDPCMYGKRQFIVKWSSPFALSYVKNYLSPPGQVERAGAHVNIGITASKFPAVWLQVIPFISVETLSYL